MTSLFGLGFSTYDQDLPAATPGNLHSIEYFAAAMAGLIGVFIVQHWATYPSAWSSSTPARLFGARNRLFRKVALRKLYGFPSAGHAMVTATYVVINIILLFTMLEWPLPLLSDLGRRLGWLAVANLALVFVLALKNTPLSHLAGYSFDHLNCLHQIAGYTTILLAILHTVVFIVARAQEHTLCNIIDIAQHPGMVALAAMIIILVSSLLLKDRKYELFYVLHIIFSLIALVTVGLHRNDISTYTIRAIFFIAGIYLLDRLIRAIGLFIISRRQIATLAPLPAGGTMVTLHRPIHSAKAGQFIFLTISAVSRLQSHPFTIVSTSPPKFIIDSQDGFTGKLHAMALKETGISLKAKVEGPYGTMPDFRRYDKVILMAGGTGASFTFAVLGELVRALREGRGKEKWAGAENAEVMVEFVWALREQRKLEWYKDELTAIQSSPFVNLSIHITSDPQANLTHKIPAPLSDLDLEMSRLPTTIPPPLAGESEAGLKPSLSLSAGRPDVKAIIREVVKSTGRDKRIIVAACGPEGLMIDTRNTVARCTTVGGPSINLHIEAFGW